MRGVAFCAAGRSEERRVGKECRSRWSPYHEKKNINVDEDRIGMFKQLDGGIARVAHADVDRVRSFFFFSSRRRHTRYIGDWSSDVCSSDLLSNADWTFAASTPSSLAIDK